ncbi:MAG: NUDIX hydrolase [Sphingomonadales bacterium]|nr:NUDIX hydrolase [Sphingomonadales bacterium]
MSETPTAPPKVIPAATVVIFRHCPQGGAPQLLMVQRAKEMRFAGGAAVFPGGRTDEADRVLAASLAPDADPEVTAARVAGIRETLEETGLLVAVQEPVSPAEAAEARALLLEQGELAPVLERFGWSVDLEALVPFARWCPMMDGAFDARFFLVDLGTGAVEVAVDATENTRLFWASAAEVLRLADAGEIQVIFPTRRNLDRLAQFTSFAEARAHAESIPVRMITPRPVERDGERWLAIPEDHGYPVTSQLMSTVRRGL